MPFVVFLAAPGMEEMKNTFDNQRLTNSMLNSGRNLANFERNSSIRMSSRRAKTMESISSLYVEEVRKWTCRFKPTYRVKHQVGKNLLLTLI